MRPRRARVGLVVFAVVFSWFSGCRAGVQTVPPPAPAAPPEADANVKRLGYTVQVGAFAILDNARTLTRALSGFGLDAFYFPARSGLYKVRFGDFPSRDAAVREANRLLAKALIKDYFIVAPEDYAVYRQIHLGEDLREKLAATAESFIGVEYSWGGTTSRGGFDCSGLVRAVYQLNGLSLPRSVQDQYGAGTTVSRDRLLKGDLVFFSASPGGELSHVGIYIGQNVFIHAPGKGKQVRRESLANSYFKEHFSGARAYLRARP